MICRDGKPPARAPPPAGPSAEAGSPAAAWRSGTRADSRTSRRTAGPPLPVRHEPGPDDGRTPRTRRRRRSGRAAPDPGSGVLPAPVPTHGRTDVTGGGDAGREQAGIGRHHPEGDPGGAAFEGAHHLLPGYLFSDNAPDGRVRRPASTATRSRTGTGGVVAGPRAEGRTDRGLTSSK